VVISVSKRFIRSVIVLSTILVFSLYVSAVDFPRGTISASYCYGTDNLNYLNLDANYYVYYLTLAGYPISYMNVFGGISYKYDKITPQRPMDAIEYRFGAQLVVLFVGVKPTFESGTLVYKNLDSCYFYVGGQYPILWDGDFSGNH